MFAEKMEGFKEKGLSEIIRMVPASFQRFDSWTLEPFISELITSLGRDDNGIESDPEYGI